MRKIRSWGVYSSNVCKVHTFESAHSLKKLIKDNTDIIAYANGGSYGDCALSEKVIKIDNNKLNFIINFTKLLIAI